MFMCGQGNFFFDCYWHGYAVCSIRFFYQNKAEAAKWYHKAAEQGNSKAQEVMQRLTGEVYR